MPHIDFSAIEEAKGFAPIPEGVYRVKVDDVEETSTQHGDEMWKLAFSVIDGENAGRRIFDNLVFSQRAYPRAKLICSRLGLDVSGELDLTPDTLLDRTCRLTVDVAEYEDANGDTKTRNTVPYDGYAHDKGGEGSDGGDPF